MSTECKVKTTVNVAQCCKFPFLYKGIERTSCVKGVTTDRKWCGLTYNYDNEKQWGWCPGNRPGTINFDLYIQVTQLGGIMFSVLDSGSSGPRSGPSRVQSLCHILGEATFLSNCPSSL